MAGIRISALNELTQLQDNFYFVIVDTVEDKTKKFNSSNLNLGQIKIGNPTSGSYDTSSLSWTSSSLASNVLQDISYTLTSLATGSHIQNTDIGTDSQTFELHMSGSSSVLLKESSSVLIVRDSTDTQLGNFQAATGTFYTVYSNTLIVSNSVIYSSGSTKFGDTLDDTHQFTGSVSITGIEQQQVAYANSNGALTGSSNLYYDGSALNINGGLEASYKSFKIPHPTKQGKMLVHGSLEGPEHSVFIRGISDKLIIDLPEYWTKLVDENTITVQITPVGNWEKLYVQKIEDNKVYISRSAVSALLDLVTANSPRFYYHIYGERKDINKLQIEI